MAIIVLVSSVDHGPLVFFIKCNFHKQKSTSLCTFVHFKLLSLKKKINNSNWILLVLLIDILICDHHNQTLSSTFRFFFYYDIFLILTLTSIMTCQILRMNIRRVRQVNRGCSFLLVT